MAATVYVLIGASDIYYDSKKYVAGQTYKVSATDQANLIALGASAAPAVADTATGNAIDVGAEQGITAAAAVTAYPEELTKGPDPEDLS